MKQVKLFVKVKQTTSSKKEKTISHLFVFVRDGGEQLVFSIGQIRGGLVQL